MHRDQHRRHSLRHRLAHPADSAAEEAALCFGARWRARISDEQGGLEPLGKTHQSRDRAETAAQLTTRVQIDAAVQLVAAELVAAEMVVAGCLVEDAAKRECTQLHGSSSSMHHHRPLRCHQRQRRERYSWQHPDF